VDLKINDINGVDYLKLIKLRDVLKKKIIQNDFINPIKIILI